MYTKKFSVSQFGPNLTNFRPNVVVVKTFYSLNVTLTKCPCDEMVSTKCQRFNALIDSIYSHCHC